MGRRNHGQEDIRGVDHTSHPQVAGCELATPDYEQIGFAGKCGLMLNALAASSQADLAEDRANALAKANGISVRLELPAILAELERQRLIDRSASGMSVLGLTTSQTLEHTSTIFDASSPSPCEQVAIDLAERTSELPVVRATAAEYVADTYHIAKAETSDILQQCAQIGFFDAEAAAGQQVYFNGNLFRREDIAKANAVLSSLSEDDRRKLVELTERLKASGCIAADEATGALGKELYSKMVSIGFIDQNSIGNESGTFTFVTRPAAFSKFTNSAADDAFDLAKAFVTSLTFGMTTSPYGRGRIRMIEALMSKLINGNSVGPATAIGQDYKVLEMKGVVEVRPAGDGRFYMRLLKREVGQLALAVITEGETGGTPLLELPGVSATRYDGPEANRSVIRKRQAEPLKKGVAKLLSDLRTGVLR